MVGSMSKKSFYRRERHRKLVRYAKAPGSPGALQE
jgi:hypothetical protein